MRILDKTICFFDGHIAEPFLTEDEHTIYVKRCSRCHCVLGMPHWKHVNRQIGPPPGSKYTQKSWNKFCDQQEEQIRMTLKI